MMTNTLEPGCARWLGALFLLVPLGTPAGLLARVPDGDGKREPTVSIGDKVKDFSLRDLQGAPHRLSSYKKKAIVLAFNGIGCPISKLYASRLQRIHEEYGKKGLQVLGINANQQDGVRELRAFANKYGLSFPILKDHENVVADGLSAERTTEVFLLDSSLALRYRGRIDDQYTITQRSVGLRKDRPEVRYLTEAIETVLAGKEVRTPRTEALGCVIGKKRRVRDATSITYHGHVEQIIQSKCQPCHRKGQIAPFELVSYDDAAGWAGMIREVVENRRMPPWHADPRYGRFSNDRSLSAEERTSLIRWVDNGTPRGDPEDGSPAVDFPGDWQIGKPDAVFETPRAFHVPAEGTVDYQYFTVKTSFEEDRWVQAMEIRPGHHAVVHHILIFCVDPKDPERSRRETRGGTRGYFAAMVPGERPIIYEEGLAKRLPSGATLIFQIHYTTNGKAVTDRSRIGMVFARKPVKHRVRTRSAVETRLRIPASAKGHEVSARYTFTRDARILSFLPHMHLRGSAFEYRAHHPARVKVSKAPWEGSFHRRTIERLRFDRRNSELIWVGELSDKHYEALAKVYTSKADRLALADLRKKSRSEILLKVGPYDFGWQNTYRLAEPKRMERGSILEARATYDNSPSNPALTRDMWNKEVRWGEQNWEEMMIGYFDVVAVEGRDFR